MLLLRQGLIGLLLACCWIGPVAAQPDDEPGIQLNPKQRRALRAIRARYQGRLNDVQMKLEGRRLELAQLLRQDNVEKDAVKSKLDEILDLERERQQLNVDLIFESKSQLSPAQWGPFRRRLVGLFLERRRGGQLPRRESDLTSP